MKKKEKEVERVLEKWQKVADTQSKVSTAQSGMRCANVAVVDGNEVLGKGQGFLEVALEQAEQARNHLSNENLFLRKLVLRTLNEVQSMLHQTQSMLPGDQITEEVPFHLLIPKFLLKYNSLFRSPSQPCFLLLLPMLRVTNWTLSSAGFAKL